MRTNEHMVNGVADVIANYDPRRDSLEAAARKAIQAALDASPLPAVEAEMREERRTVGYAIRWLSMLNADAPEEQAPSGAYGVACRIVDRDQKDGTDPDGTIDNVLAALASYPEPQPRPDAALRALVLWVAKREYGKMGLGNPAHELGQLMIAAEREGR